METIAEGVHASSMAVLDIEASAGERFLRLVLNHFDRIHSNFVFQSLMQHEMIRLHRGEVHTLGPLVGKTFSPAVDQGAVRSRGGNHCWRTDPCRRDADHLRGTGGQRLLLPLRAHDASRREMSTSWSRPLSAFVARRPSNTWARPSSLTASTDHASPPRVWPPRPCRNRKNSKQSKSRTARTTLPKPRQLM